MIFYQRWSLAAPQLVHWAPALVSVAYFIGAESAFLVGTLSDRIFAPFWPPNVILFCGLLLADRRQWWRYIAFAFPAHAAAEWTVGMAAPQMLAAFFTNCFVALFNAAVAQRTLGGAPWLGSLRKILLYVLTTALAGPALTAIGGALVTSLGGGTESYLEYWTQWYLANALGFLTIGPAFLIWIIRSQQPVAAPHLSEAVALGVGLLIACVIAFQLPAEAIPISFMPALLYSPLPLILWSAMRFGSKGASGAILVVTVAVLARALNDSGLFVGGNPATNVFALQLFLIGLSVTLLLLGGSVDEARQAERAARESEERMAFAAVAANIGLWRFEPSTNNLWATDHCRLMLGVAQGLPLTTRSVQGVIHPDDRRVVGDAMKSAINSEREVACEFRVITSDSQTRWLRARARSDHDHEGKAFQVSGVFMDISAAKEAEAEAELRRNELSHAMRAAVLGELSGAIAHELNQPLTSILSNAQAALHMLNGKSGDRPALREVIDDIVLEDKRASAVIVRLRGLLRKGDSKTECVEVNQLIRSTLELVRSELVGRRVRVDTDLADHVPPINGDAVQLQQVLLNLILNAMDAMASTPTSRRVITINTRVTERGEIEIAVADQGVGLQAEDEDRAFEPFFTTKSNGLGLGLSICASIAKLHGGRLTLNNRADGGARAGFTLPSQGPWGSA
jgi:signal transduction histidine kinase/integral membrane sensor domain MASE1